MEQGTPRISLWKEDALAALLFLVGMYVVPLLVFSLERVAP